MSILLGAITLPDDLLLDPALESIQKKEVVSMPTRGGNALRWEKTLKDRPFDLVGGEDFAWMTLATAQAVVALADTDLWEGNLNLHGTLFPVYFRHSDAPVVSFVPVPEYNYADRTGTDKVCEVRIKLVWKVA